MTINSYFYIAMNLVVDIGNTLTKVAVFDGTDMVFQDKASRGDLEVLGSVLQEYTRLDRCIISSVGPGVESLVAAIQPYLSTVIVMDKTTRIPLENLYLTKESLGNDRLAAAVGGWTRFPGHAVLIVDAGTALTFDLVNNQGQYLGGSISPGMHMRFHSLHQFTNRLPLVLPSEKFGWPGNTTAGSIVAGVQSGMVMEIEGMIHDVRKAYPGLSVILTGGDALFFDKILKSSIFVDLNLVLTGLNRILMYHVETP